MKLIIAFLLVMFMVSNTYAMTMLIPFRCYKKTLIAEFVKEGIILDEEDENADGYIENNGTSYKIHLYRNPTDFQPFIDIPRRVQREKNGN